MPRWFKHATKVLDKKNIIMMFIITITKVQDKEDKREMVNSHPEPGRHTRTELSRRLRVEMQWSKMKQTIYVLYLSR